MKEKDSSPLVGREKKELVDSTSSLSPKNPIVKSVMHWRNPRFYSLSIPTRVFQNEIRQNVRVAISANGDELKIRFLPRGDSK